MSLLARGHIYGERILCDPPCAQRLVQTADGYEIFFSHAEEGLEVKGGAIADLKCLRCGVEIPYKFELCKDVLKIIPKESCDRIQLGMGKWICINLYNRSGLPAVPFDIPVLHESEII